MATVHRLSPRPGAPGLGAAVEAFLGTIANRNTAKAYAIVLRALATEIGEQDAAVRAGGRGWHNPPRRLVNQPLGRRGAC